MRCSVKDKLEALVLEMVRSGSLYRDAVAEFKKCFIQAALKDNRGNQINAARALGMHRNSLARTLAKLCLDVRSFRPSRRPPMSERLSASDHRVSR